MLVRLFSLPIALVFGVLFCPRVHAEDLPPRGELLELVGAEAGLCIEISDLGRQVPQLLDSELVDRLEKFPVYVDWKQSSEFQKLAEIQRIIEKHTGQPLGRLALKLFGQKVVFAVYPREAGEPAGVLLLRAVDRESLESALAVWNGDERVTVETISFSTSAYHKRIEPKDPKQPQFYFTQGPVFAISDDETVIQDIVKRTLDRMERPALLGSETYQLAKSSLPADCWATLYFAPRAWKTGWEFDEGKSRAEKVVAGLWKRCRAVAAGLRTEQGLAVDVVLHYDPTDLPERWLQVVERTSGFPEFLNQVPARALVVMAGKQDLAGIDQIITAELNEQDRLKWQNARQIGQGFLLGLDLFEDVLPKFQPNWGVYLVPREPLVEGALPVEGLFAVELPPVPDDQNPVSVRKALENALNTAFNLLAAVQKQPSAVKTEKHETGAVHWVDSVGLYRPAYSVSNDYLIFASSPGVVTEFLSAETPKLTGSRVYRLWAERQNPPEGQVLFISWQSIRGFFEKNETFLLNQAIESHALPREEAEKRLTRLREVLEVLDAVYLGIEIQPDRIRLTTGGIAVE